MHTISVLKDHSNKHEQNFTPGPSTVRLQVSKVKRVSFKPICANVDVDLDSFKQPLLRYLAHYFLQIPMYVCC